MLSGKICSSLTSDARMQRWLKARRPHLLGGRAPRTRSSSLLKPGMDDLHLQTVLRRRPGKDTRKRLSSCCVKCCSTAQWHSGTLHMRGGGGLQRLRSSRAALESASNATVRTWARSFVAATGLPCQAGLREVLGHPRKRQTFEARVS